MLVLVCLVSDHGQVGIYDLVIEPLPILEGLEVAESEFLQQVGVSYRPLLPSSLAVGVLHPLQFRLTHQREEDHLVL